jgi:DNA-binding CsgD family transcriptional regulator
MPEKISDWLKGNFSPYGHAGFIENFANQIKARFCYMTRNYPTLLLYIEEMKQRKSYLFFFILLLAIEACVHYKRKDKQKAFAALSEAYKTAASNDIILPFIELGKDMRGLTSAALKADKGKIPKTWLETIRSKSASYAKQQGYVITEYRLANRIADSIVITPREAEILTDLSRGLSRTEIAVIRGLSLSTVKMAVSKIYLKLDAENQADLIRIAVERKLI